MSASYVPLTKRGFCMSRLKTPIFVGQIGRKGSFNLFPASSLFVVEPAGALASVPASDFGANFAENSVHPAKIGANLDEFGPNLGPKIFGTWVPQYGLISGTQVPNFRGPLLEPSGPPLEPTGGQSAENGIDLQALICSAPEFVQIDELGFPASSSSVVEPAGSSASVAASPHLTT